MRKVRSFLRASAVGSFAASVGLIVGLPTPAAAEGSFDGLTECIEEQRSLSALFLVDTSQSLRDTDPSSARVPALQSAVSAFNTLRASATATDPITVYVDFLEFGTRTVRSFPDQPEWQELPSDVEEIADRLTAYRSRNSSQDTDYVGALKPWADSDDARRPGDEIGAVEMLERAPENSCQLLIWFTDGQLDIDFQGSRKEFNWAPEPLILRSEAGESAIESRAEEVLCDAGGVVDGLRLKQSGRLYAPFVATVALEAGSGEPQDFGLMRSMALGDESGQSCGSRDPNGVFLRATQLPQLVGQLRRAVLGNPKAEQQEISTCLAADIATTGAVECEFSFFVAESLTSFNLLTTSTGRGVDVSLVDPTGSVLPLRSEGLVQNSVGASLQMSRPLDEVFLIDAELPTASAGWAGEWKVRYTTDDPAVAERIRNSAAIYVVGSLEARLRPGPELIRGRDGRFRVELVSSDNNPRGPLAFGDGSRIEVRVAGELLPQPEISPDGSFEYVYSVPEDLDADQLAVEVELFPQFSINEVLEPIPLDGFAGQLGFLQVKDPPRYPIVEFLTSGDFSVLDVDNPVAVGEIRVDATSTLESGGCVELQDASTDHPESMNGVDSLPSFEILRGGVPIERGVPCAIELAAGEVEILELRIAFSPEQLRVPAGQVRGQVMFRSTSSVDPSEAGSFPGEFAASIEPIIVVKSNFWAAVTLMLIAVAVPVLLMYGVSIFYSSRFQVPDNAMRVSIPVIYRNGRFYRNQDGREGRMVLRDDDLSLSGLEGGWTRQADIGSFSFAIRPSLSPIGQPVSSVREADAEFVTSRHGSRGGVGRPGSNLGNVWALAVDAPDLVGAGLAPDGSLHEPGQMDPLHGRFMALVPSGPDGPRVFDEIVAEVERQAPLALEPAVLKAASAAKERETRVAKPSDSDTSVAAPDDVIPERQDSSGAFESSPDDSLPGDDEWSPRTQFDPDSQGGNGQRRRFGRRSNPEISAPPAGFIDPDLPD